MSIIGSPVVVGKKPEQTKTVSPTTSQQVVTPDSGKVLSSVTVNAAVLQSKTVTPTASGFTVSPDSGNYGLYSVKVNGDTNLVAGNIKSGVSIFGVTGTYNPTTSAIVITGLISTDTVTCSGDGKSYSATWDSTTQHWEIIGLPLGTFTVTATRATKSTSQTVLIDIVGIYDITMNIGKWLYLLGDECESLTGGWSQGAAGANNGGSITKNSNNITLYTDSGSNTVRGLATNNAINISGYTKVCMIADITVAGTENGCFGGWGLTPVRSWPWNGDSPNGQLGTDDLYGYNRPSGSVKTGTDVLLEFNINNTGDYYAFINNASGSNCALTIVLKYFWLE